MTYGQKYDLSIIVPAYNDAAGITAAFNMNLLERLNRELDATFNLDKFHHDAIWNDVESRIEMHLVSDADQDVTIGDKTISFARGESIFSENSFKFTRERFATLAMQAGFTVEKIWTDEREWFSVQYLETI